MDTTLSAAPDAAVTRLVYDGRNGELFRLWMKVLFLTAVTFGIYRFWGRTRIRKYLWNHTSLLGSRLEYDGTGGELFRRFLVAGLVIILIILPANIAQLVGLRLWMIGLIQGVQALLLAYLYFVAVYAGRRYRLSRTLWRGLRGGLDGSAAGYGAKAFGYSLLYLLTLTFVTPWQLVGLWRYQMDHSGIGDWEAEFEGSGRRLLRPYAVAFAIGVLAIVAFFVLTLAGGTIVKWVGLGPRVTGLQAVLRGALIYVPPAIVLVASMIMAWLQFYVRAIGYLVSNTHFGRVSFATHMRERDLFRLQLGNLAIIIFSLGLLSPFVAQRLVRFVCRHLEILNAHELDALTQAEGRRERGGGEGLAQLLDTGGFA